MRVRVCVRQPQRCSTQPARPTRGRAGREGLLASLPRRTLRSKVARASVLVWPISTAVDSRSAAAAAAAALERSSATVGPWYSLVRSSNSVRKAQSHESASSAK